MRKEKKYHYIYKTTNIITNKYYIGMHSSDVLEDGYLGSGRRLRYSLNKYGKENHTREILEFCKTRKELKSREEEIVNLDEIAKTECMNLQLGGGGYEKATDELCKKLKESWNEERKNEWSIHMKDFWTDKRKNEHSDKLKGHIGHTKCKGVKKHKGFGALVSAGNIGKPKSKIHRENISLARTGKKYPYSRKMTEELETQIKSDLLANIKVKKITEKYNVSQWMVYKLKQK